MAAKKKQIEKDAPTRILEAALELFAANGFDATSVRMLARKVGMRESSLYNHFENKNAILLALVEKYGSAMAAERLEANDFRKLSDDPENFCKKYVNHSIKQWSDPREQQFQAVLGKERNRSETLHKNYVDQLFGRKQRLLEEYFTHFAETGLIESDDPKATAKLFLAGLTHLRLEHFMLNPTSSNRNANRAANNFANHFLALIKVKPRRKK